MNNKFVSLSVLLGLAFSFDAMAATQTVTSTQTSFEVSASDTVSFTINYPNTNPDATGLGLKIYYDSSKLTPLEGGSLVAGLSDLNTDKLAGAQNLSDDSNGDSDGATDKFFNLAWAATSQFQPIWNPAGEDLVTVTFRVTENFSADTVINFTGSAAAGNTFRASPVNITYKDTVVPSITAPADVTIEAEASSTSVSQTQLGDASATDNKDPSPVVSYAPKGPYSLGANTITWTATDSSNNKAKDTQVLTVVDTTSPTIVAPADLSKVASGSKTAVDLGSPKVNDAVDSNPTYSADKTGPFVIGTHTITWTVKDSSGNTATATQTVIIKDTAAPILVKPSKITKEATGPKTGVVFSSVVATDVIDVSITAVADNKGPFTVGEHTVTWTATNTRGKKASITQTISIVDTTAPSITVPQSKTVQATGTKTSVDIGKATATDLVDGTVEVVADKTGPFTVGTHKVAWTATDSHGNKATKKQTITVSDGSGPSITAPADITKEATGETTPVSLGAATATDAVDGTLTARSDKAGPFAVGQHTVTWTATDSSNNKATATQTVTITDTTNPEITAPADKEVPATGKTTVVALGSPIISDIADKQLQVTKTPEGPYTVGTHTIIWTATDKSGNTASDTQTIIVTDTALPTLTKPASLKKEATAVSTPVSFTPVIAQDVIDGSITAVADNNGPFTVGEHTVTWTATNTRGKTVTVTQKVTIVDTTAPTISAPPSKTVQATGNETIVDIGIATATDLVDGTVEVAADKTGPFTVGTHTVTWTATDSRGNKATKKQTITVSDANGPSITAPSDITKEATGATTAVDLGAATASDDIDGELTATANVSGPFSVGSHTVTWTATDSAGNKATATQTVTITDSTAPIITLPEVVRLTATGINTRVDYQASATDIVDGTITPYGVELVNGEQQAIPTTGLVSGKHHLVWIAVDTAGNESTVNQVIEITPLVNFITSQSVSAGDSVTVTAQLTGNPVIYPVSIPYSIDTTESTVVNDETVHTATNGTLTIQSGLSGSFTFSVASNPALNAKGKGDLVFVMGSVTNAAVGAANTHKVTISAGNIPPVVSIAMNQSDTQVTAVALSAGNVQVVATATDSASQTLSYDWSETDATLSNLSSINNHFEFDPVSLPVGLYTVVVIVSDNGEPINTTKVETRFIVKAGGSPVLDADGDGVSDDKDHISEANRLTGHDGGSAINILESEAGTKLRLGKYALKQGKNGAIIDLTDLPEVPAAYKQGGQKIYDFEVSGIQQGSSILIVLPLEKPIPSSAAYLKSDGNSWKPFSEDDHNAVYSAQRISNGICPSTGDAKYIQGLKQGDYCIQLKIEDGSANDTDGLVNGRVADPGVVVGLAGDDNGETGEEENTETTRYTSTGGGTLPLFLLPMLLFIRRFKL